MLLNLSRRLLDAVTVSLHDNTRRVHVPVTDMQQALERLADFDTDEPVHSCGDNRRTDCYGAGWHITLVADENPNALRLRLHGIRARQATKDHLLQLRALATRRQAVVLMSGL